MEIQIDGMPLYAYGDNHSNFGYMAHNLSKLGNCNILQLGDFGVYGYNIDKMDLLDDFLMEKNIKLYAIRGNHDAPSMFSSESFNIWENIKLLPDYTVIKHIHKKILCIGGAISIDRMVLRESLDWWRDENFVFDKEKISSMENITHLVTHNTMDFSMPSHFNDIVRHFAKNDRTLINDLMAERKLITEMFSLLTEKNKVTNHYYGHFHFSNTEKIGECTHHLLNVDEIKEIID